MVFEKSLCSLDESSLIIGRVKRNNISYDPYLHIRTVIDRIFLPIRLSIKILPIWYFDPIQIYVTFNC